MRFKDKVKADDNRKRAFTYLTEQKGLEPHVAAGIIGNFMQESGHSLNVEAYNPDDLGKPSYGLAQWRGDRRANLKKVAGNKANTLEGQLDFMMWEFDNTEKRAYKKLQEADTTEEAALAFSQYYERPHKDYAHNEKRVNHAKKLFNTYVGTDEINPEYRTPQPQPRTDIDQSQAYAPEQEHEAMGYSEPMVTNSPQIPYLEEGTPEEVEAQQAPILDEAVNKIESRKQEMAMIQQLMKTNQVQYIDPNENADPEPNSYGYPSMEKGGETDPKKETTEPPTEEYDYFNDPDKLFTKETKVASVPKRAQGRRREKQPLNLAVRETTSVTRRDTSNPLLSPIVEEEYDEMNDTKNMNPYDIMNPTVITHNKGKAALEEKVKSKSEFLNPMGLEKIDPNSFQSEEEVARIQAQLIENGYDLGEYGADGKMGGKTKAAIDKFNSKLSMTDEVNIGDFKSPEQVKQLQEFLINKGFDLNPNKKFEDDGVDGQLGDVTKKAMLAYNKTIAKDNLPYKGVKDGEGFLGACTEEQCSEYVQNEIWRNLNPNMSRTEWNAKTGLQGDAWTIGKNIVKAGGRELKLNQVASGDVVTIFTGGNSPSQGDADAAGSGTTHTAVIDQVNEDGSFYVLHNVHKGSELTGWKGQEYRDLVKPDGKFGTTWGSFQVKKAYRPSTKGVAGKKNNNLREDVTLAVDPDKAEALGGIETFLGNASEKVQTYIEPLNDFKNKKKFSNIFELEEDEYQSLAQLTIGILGQESNFGTSVKAIVKEPVARASKMADILTWGQIDSPVFKKDEPSRGAGQLKYNTNFHSDLTEFGINKGNFTDDKNVPIASMYKLATDYKKMLKKGYSKKDALYRAAVLYNSSLQGESEGKTREEWAENYDVDYANKAINFASALGVQGEGKAYKTLIDELLVEDNVYKWNKETYSGRN